MNGLNITPNDFERLPQKHQMRVLFENTEELKRMVHTYKFHQKIQYLWIMALTFALGLGKFVGLI
jgi:predicted amidophosphoribosyltransferase